MGHLLPHSDHLAARGEEGRPSLREQALAVRSLSPAMLTHPQAGLFAAGGLLGFVGVVLPHPSSFDVQGLLSLQFACMATAAALLLLGDRMPMWALHASPYAGTVLNTLALTYAGKSDSAYALFYLWVGLYAFYFLPRKQAALLGGFTVLNYAAVVFLMRLSHPGAAASEVNGDVHNFVVITGTLVIGGAFIVLLRDRVGRLISQLTDAASTDPLTGLLNRRGFHRVIQMELERSRRSGRPSSLLLADCDHFKRLNDRFGHAAGDDALQRISQLVSANKRRIDTAARIGGEEFALVLPDTDQHEAYVLAERLRVRFGEVFRSPEAALTMSFGVATFPTHGTSDDGLLRAADEALYAAKALGRDRTVIHSAEVEGILSAQEQAGGRDHAQLATVLSLAEALDVRDSGTARHSQTVGRYSEMMARQLGLPPEQVERVRLAGVLHDIGKIGVPDSILRKPGPLTDAEYAQMKTHPEIGARILGGAGLDDIRSWILAHHERPDGCGYPRGLGDQDIPLEAKILAVADAYEAMTSDRVYRSSIGADAARGQLLENAGRQFDPVVVDAFLAALEHSDDAVTSGVD